MRIVLTVPPAIPVITGDTSVVVTQPGAAMFDCSAVARPRPSIVWYRVELNGSLTVLTDSGVTISEMNGNTERILNSTLAFNPTCPFFTAEYICEAVNPVSSADTNVTLTVYGKGEKKRGREERERLRERRQGGYFDLFLLFQLVPISPPLLLMMVSI